MNDVLTSPLVGALAAVLCHFLWQGFAIAVGYWLVQETIGPRTANDAAQSGLLVTVVAHEQRIPALLDALSSVPLPPH